MVNPTQISLGIDKTTEQTYLNENGTWVPFLSPNYPTNYQTIANLRSSAPAANQFANVEGYYAVGDGGGGQFYGVTGGSYTDNGGTIITTGLGVTASSAWLRIIDGFVSGKMFGAVGDGSNDDTAFIQRAIDYGNTHNLSIFLDGQFLITSSLIINRQVDTTSNILTIFANGTGNGLYVNANITIFDSTLSYSVDPVSEFVEFRGVHFQAANRFGTAFVISPKFLRIGFLDCNFRNIKCLQAAHYTQTWRFNNCTIRYWANGSFFSSPGCYDISFIGNIVENGDIFIYLADASNALPAFGVRVIGNLIEGCAQSAITLGGAQGCTISGNYFELNGTAASPNINLYASNITTSGLVISGNFFSMSLTDNTVWAIYWGPTRYAISENNYCYGQLHNNNDIAAGTYGISSSGDYATQVLWKVPRGNIYSNSIALPTVNINQGSGGAFSINASIYSIFQLVTGLSTGNSCNFPTGGVNGQRITIEFWNETGGTITSWTFTGNWKVGAWTNLAYNYVRNIDFIYDGSAWREVSRSGDIPL